jgi:hypothetical protein
MSAIEHVGTGIAHAATGYGLGCVVDWVFPRLEHRFINGSPDHKSAATLFAEVFLQFSAGWLLIGESMKFLLPDNSYLSPIGDGLSVMFFFMPQEHLWAKMRHLRSMTQHLIDPPKTTKPGGVTTGPNPQATSPPSDD